MPHPQIKELTGAIARFLDGAPDAKLYVYEQDVKMTVTFLHVEADDAEEGLDDELDDDEVDETAELDPKLFPELHKLFEDLDDVPERHPSRPGPAIQFEVLSDQQASIDAAALSGFTDPDLIPIHMSFGPNRGKNLELLRYRATIDDTATAAETCVRVLTEVQGAARDAWLWITTEYEYDLWPHPLPKPENWPPPAE